MNIRFFIDLNETLIRTGEVSEIEKLEEIKDLYTIKSLFEKISENNYLEIVFITGNSFEYSRRIEESIGFKNIINSELIIVSENGLLCRSFKTGLLWKCNITDKYKSNIDLLLNELKSNNILSKCFYEQGNEIRTTLKPVNNKFHKFEIDEICKLANKFSISEFAKFYTHDYYVDIDPKSIILDGILLDFDGKYFAANRLLKKSNFLNIGIGDSKSDISTFKALEQYNGYSFWVSNTDKDVIRSYDKAKVLENSFTKGVIETIKKNILSINN